VLHHHERWDGRGYPAGLAAEEIPLGARILLVADAYDAMTTDREYRRRRSHTEAVAELERCAGTQFDPGVVAAFVSALYRATGPVAAARTA
jgi:HD-GYP domain-containing protein (c-di-GMP phosphodiesterase class II)